MLLGLSTERQGQNLTLTVLLVPYSLDMGRDTDRNALRPGAKRTRHTTPDHANTVSPWTNSMEAFP